MNEKEIKFLKLQQVLDKIHMSRSTFYEMLKNGLCPKPVKFGLRNNLWVETEVNAWINKKIEEKED
jgi:Predicted transcriptional regulator